MKKAVVSNHLSRSTADSRSSIFRRWITAGSCAVAILALGIPANAGNLVQNGNFSTTTSIGTGPVNGQGQVGYNIGVTDWTLADTATNGSYFFELNCPACDTLAGGVIGTDGQYGDFALWGPGTGVSNGLANSPDGGNFIGSDPLYQNTAIEQNIGGLVANAKYAVSFYWAAAQQYNHTGSTNSLGWLVSLGSQTLATTTVNLASQGFSGWMQTTLVFTATSANEVLSFLSTGTGAAALPPFVLLDGVSLTAAAPEPVSWVLILGGVGLVAGLRARAKNRLAR